MQSANFADASAATVPSSARAERRRNLSLRVVSGLVLAPAMVLLIALGGKWFGVAIGIAAAIGLREWLTIVGGKPVAMAYVAAVAILVVYWSLGVQAALGVLAAAAIVTAGLAYVAGRPNPWLAALGLPYVALTLIALVWLRDSGPMGWKLVLFVFFVVWASDIGAFFVGRAIGGPKLAPRVSPNKTWAGLIGGTILALGVALAWALAVDVSSPADAMIVAVGLSLIGQGGDLFESSVKRRFQLKDSGGLIPGHGGMLDRIDALLWVAPIFAVFDAIGGTAGWMP